MISDVKKYNQQAWDHQVSIRNRWTIPVSEDEIAQARRGEWSVVLTPSKPVPMEWFPNTRGKLNGVRLLALASGGGQQGPLFSAAGADVVVFDQSIMQLKQDELVAKREGLTLTTVQGDMCDLSVFKNESFDFIFHPCSNGFVPDVNPVWREAYRVLKKGGTLIAGFVNPILYSVDPVEDKNGKAILKYSIPYSDLTSLNDEERRQYTDINDPLCFGHTLEDQIGGQLRAGFKLIGMYEDTWGKDAESTGALNKLISCFVATRAVK